MNELENKENDAKQIEELLANLGMQENTEKNENGSPVSFRLGKTNITGGKPRPYLIKFQEKKFKFDFLKKWEKLKENNLWAKPDLTIKQQEENRQLFLQLKQRKEKGEDVIIKRGKIVPRNQ